MDADVEYLLSFLQDEFRDFPEVRVRVAPATGLRKAADLEQDYDPGSSDLHLRRGVVVVAQSREYYFPAEWISARQFIEVQKLSREIREFVEGRVN